MFDYCFAENGLTAYRQGKELPSNSFIEWLGEEKYKKMANFILHYIADLDVPVKRYVPPNAARHTASELSMCVAARSLNSATA